MAGKFITSLIQEKMKEVDSWLEQFREKWESRLDKLDKVLSQIKSKSK
jgi:hypothetical protein